MAKTAVYDYSTTASSNSDFDGTDSSGATGKVKDGDNYARSIASHVKGFALDLGAVNTVGGTADAITVTLSSAPSALVDGMRITINASAANTGATTLNVTPAGGSAFGAKKVMKWSAGSEAELSANDIPAANALIELVYDSARNAAAGAWMLLGTSVAAATTSAAGIVKLQYNAFYNGSIVCSVAANALTIAIKGWDGNDPSASNPVIIPSRSATISSGGIDPITITAATSLVISSGSTMGFTSGVIGKLWIVGFNDGGTFRLGAVNCLSGTSILPLRNGIYSSTAEGGAGGADTAQVIYTGTAVTSKAMVILGYLEATEATAGTWATAPSLVQVINADVALPGTAVQVLSTGTAALTTSATTLPYDDSIPQSGEGVQVLSQAITPKSAASLLHINSIVQLGSSSAPDTVTAALFQDSTANSLIAGAGSITNAGIGTSVPLEHWMLAATTSATTFKVRVGSNAVTVSLNGANGTRKYGGVANSILVVQEITT